MVEVKGFTNALKVLCGQLEYFLFKFEKENFFFVYIWLIQIKIS